MARKRGTAIALLSLAAILAALKSIPDLIRAIFESSGATTPPDPYFAGVILAAVVVLWALLIAAWIKFKPRRGFLPLYALIGALGTALLITAGRWPAHQAEFRFATDGGVFILLLLQIALLPSFDRNVIPPPQTDPDTLTNPG